MGDRKRPLHILMNTFCMVPVINGICVMRGVKISGKVYNGVVIPFDDSDVLVHIYLIIK